MLTNTSLKRRIGELLTLDELFLDVEEFLLINDDQNVSDFISILDELKKTN